MASNIEPLARSICETICRRNGMAPGSIDPWVDDHWECAAAAIEAGVIDDEGNPTGRSWDEGLQAYRERLIDHPLG